MTQQGIAIDRVTGLLALLLALVAAPATADDFDAALGLLTDRSFERKSEGVQLLVTSGHPATPAILGAMLEGRLAQLDDGRLVVAEPRGRDFQVSDPVSGETLGVMGRREVNRVAVNNALRGELRATIAGLDLLHTDPARRRVAASALMGNPDPALEPVLRQALANESDSRVRKAMATTVALLDVISEDRDDRLVAAQMLAGNVHPLARNALTRLVASEEDPEVLSAARKSLDGIQTRLKLYSAAETLFFGLSLGSVLVLAAIGLAITFGVMGVINMAHGELMMLGAYTTFVVQKLMPQHIDLSIWVAIPAAFVVAGLAGIAIERGVIRFLYGRPLETLLATFGLSLILQQLVRSVFSPLNQRVASPSWMSGSWEINSALSLTLNRLYILAFCLIVFAALFVVLRRTALGLQVRAVSQNRAMARAMGVRASRVDMLTFALGAGIAGIAGVALSQLTNVGPNLGQAYIIDSFMVVVFGGVGNLWGTLVAGMSIGVMNKLLEPWAGAVLAKILLLVFIILFIQKRPRGIFPQKGRAAEA